MWHHKGDLLIVKAVHVVGSTVWVDKSNKETMEEDTSSLSLARSHRGDLHTCQVLIKKSREKWHLEKEKHTGSCQQSSQAMTGPEQLSL